MSAAKAMDACRRVLATRRYEYLVGRIGVDREDVVQETVLRSVKRGSGIVYVEDDQTRRRFAAVAVRCVLSDMSRRRWHQVTVALTEAHVEVLPSSLPSPERMYLARAALEAARGSGPVARALDGDTRRVIAGGYGVSASTVSRLVKRVTAQAVARYAG